MEILDCTLRDGSHAVDASFSTDATARIVKGLLDSGIRVIEIGRPSGIGSKKGSVADEAYLEAALPYFGTGEIGMFCRPEFFGQKQYELAKNFGLGFLRVGTDASSVEASEETIGKIREAGIKVRYSLIKAHTVSPNILAENAAKVARYGAQVITLMDSTGTLLPHQVKEYVSSVVNAVDVPVGFHGHNNLGMSVANAMAAVEAGALSMDGALRGLARSAGNAPTEMLCALMEKLGTPLPVNLFRLLDFIEGELPHIVPDMTGIKPIDLVFGYAGFHSKFLPVMKTVAEEEGVNLFRLIVEVSRKDQINPGEALAREVARGLK